MEMDHQPSRRTHVVQADAAVLFRICSEIAAHREELVRITSTLPDHELVEMQFNAQGEWLGLTYHKPHTGVMPDPNPASAHHMHLTGLGGRYTDETEARKAARQMIFNAIKFFLPEMLYWEPD